MLTQLAAKAQLLTPQPVTQSLRTCKQLLTSTEVVVSWDL